MPTNSVTFGRKVFPPTRRKSHFPAGERQSSPGGRQDDEQSPEQFRRHLCHPDPLEPRERQLWPRKPSEAETDRATPKSDVLRAKSEAVRRLQFSPDRQRQGKHGYLRLRQKAGCQRECALTSCGNPPRAGLLPEVLRPLATTEAIKLSVFSDCVLMVWWSDASSLVR